MENFIVSARKYRPATFDTVVGQGHITTTLKNAIKTQHLAQAFLFCGPRGVGKTTCARILAKTINCENLTDQTEACGQCASCKSAENNASFNVHELDAASNNSVDDIRNLIDQVRFPPQTGRFKVYIIDEVHMLSSAAFNAFLKTLEEPPSYAIFILATTEKHKILPTILSRCQIFDFNRIQNNDISEHLVKISNSEGINAERRALDLIAQKADGGLRDALSMFDLNVTFAAGQDLTYADVLENLHVLDYDYYFKITQFIADGDLSQSILLFNEILDKGFDGHHFVVGLMEHFRNLLMCQNTATVKLLEVSDDVRALFTSQAQKLSGGFLMSSLALLSQLDLNYKAAKMPKLLVEVGLMKLSQINKVLDLANLPQNSEPKPQPVADKGAATLIQPVKKIPVFKSTNKSFGTAPSTPAPEPKFVDETQVTLSSEKPSQEKIEQAWAKIGQSRTVMTEKVIFDREIKINDDTIEIVLDNDVQGDHLESIKTEIMMELRQLLAYQNLKLSWSVADIERTYKPYTAEEKYEHMLAINPAIVELRKVFNLDIGG